MKTIELLYNYNLSVDENVIRNYSLNKQNKEKLKLNKDSIIQRNEKKNMSISTIIYMMI